MERFELLHPRIVALDRINVVPQHGESPNCKEDDDSQHRQAIAYEPAKSIAPQPALPSPDGFAEGL